MEFCDIEFVGNYSDTQTFLYTDEVGRGPLAGPVISCSVAFENQNVEPLVSFLKNLGITDSKKLTTKKRLAILDKLEIDLSTLKVDETYELKLEGSSLKYILKESDHIKIDEMNILHASLDSMKRGVESLLTSSPGVCLIDGSFCFPEVSGVEQVPLVKGDSKSCFIALASIIAKEYRDYLMTLFHDKYPEYGFDKHAGYPTKFHKESIISHGVSPIHRKTFKGVREYCQ